MREYRCWAPGLGIKRPGIAIEASDAKSAAEQFGEEHFESSDEAVVMDVTVTTPAGQKILYEVGLEIRHVFTAKRVSG